MGVCWGSDDLMDAVHKHLVLRGYKCEDLFDTGRICQSKPSAALHTYCAAYQLQGSVKQLAPLMLCNMYYNAI